MRRFDASRLDDYAITYQLPVCTRHAWPSETLRVDFQAAPGNNEARSLGSNASTCNHTNCECENQAGSSQVAQGVQNCWPAAQGNVSLFHYFHLNKRKLDAKHMELKPDTAKIGNSYGRRSEPIQLSLSRTFPAYESFSAQAWTVAHF